MCYKAFKLLICCIICSYILLEFVIRQSALQIILTLAACGGASKRLLYRHISLFVKSTCARERRMRI